LESERICDAVNADTINVFWQEADWLLCRDSKWRSVEPGTRLLADGITARVGRLRAGRGRIYKGLYRGSAMKLNIIKLLITTLLVISVICL
ncbi:MAG: hypothetical protein ACL7BU_16160, partial [Candidatus Phlomobacter fragariae]